MGTAHILYVYDDALRENVDWERLARELGEAILMLTLRPEQLLEANTGPHRITWHRVGSHGNAMQWCDEVHSREVRVYLWAANCLRELRQVNDDDLRDILEAVNRERERRSTVRAGQR